MSAHAPDPALAALTRGWCALSLLHGKIEAYIERALQSRHGLSVREYSLLDVLSRQHEGAGGQLQMKQVADADVLSQSSTTRLVTRLEDRGLRQASDSSKRRVPHMAPPFARPSTRQPGNRSWSHLSGSWSR